MLGVAARKAGDAMATSIPGWTTLSESPAVLMRDYSFGGGRANAMAVRLPAQGWMIMSPPANVTPAEAQAFQTLGPVVALVENNGTHHKGLGPWRALCPGVVTYAAPAAAARIRKKGKDFGELQPTEALQPLLGDKISVFPVAGHKIGDVLVRVETEKGTLLYTSDFIANIPVLPKNPIGRLLFKLTDSGPGLKVFNIFFKFFVADAASARAALINELQAHPPSILVPAHGDVVIDVNVGPTVAALLRAR